MSHVKTSMIAKGLAIGEVGGYDSIQIGQLKCSFLLQFGHKMSKPFVLLACYHSVMPRMMIFLDD